MDIDLRAQRRLTTLEAPASTKESAAPARYEVLLTLYGEIGSNWRLLIDLRFKLLGLAPAVSAGLLLSLLSAEGLSVLARSGLGLLGLLATLALWVCDRENAKLTESLAGQARKIEEEMSAAGRRGLHSPRTPAPDQDGQAGRFRSRPDPQWPWLQHPTAATLIYGVTLASWAFALAAIWLGWA